MALVETRDMDAAEIAAAVSGQWGAGPREEPAPPPGHLFEKDDNLFTRAVSRKALAAVVSEGTKSPTPDDGPLTTDIRELIDLFAEARTFGSLIQVPPELAARLPLLEQRVNEAAAKGELSSLVAIKFQPVVEQARLLAKQYDCVVANPPYMGRKYQCDEVERFLKAEYTTFASDLYAAFIRRCISLCDSVGLVSMITMDSWMFGEDFQNARAEIVARTSVIANAHLGPRAFDEISGEVVQTCAFVLLPLRLPTHVGAYFGLTAPKSSDEKRKLLLSAQTRFDVANTYFEAFPRNAMAYFASHATRNTFATGQRLADFSEAFTGLQTGDNPRFIRSWSEVDITRVAFGITQAMVGHLAVRWFPYVKGSEFRKWYGNLSFVVNWENDGAEIRAHRSSTVRNSNYYFYPGLAYNNIAKRFSARFVDGGAIFDQKNSMFIAKSEKYIASTLAFLHSKVIGPLLEVVAQKDFNPGSLKVIPVDPCVLQSPLLTSNVTELIHIARTDWDSFETSWDFQTLPVLRDQGADAPRSAGRTLAQSQAAAAAEYLARFQRMKQLEEENNRLFIDAYGLQDELSPAVPDDQITLYRPDREQDLQRLISYALGCLMGRYSLDQPGLIYAHSGNVGFEAIYCLTPTPSAWAGGPNDARAHADGVAVKEPGRNIPIQARRARCNVESQFGWGVMPLGFWCWLLSRVG